MRAKKLCLWKWVPLPQTEGATAESRQNAPVEHFERVSEQLCCEGDLARYRAFLTRRTRPLANFCYYMFYNTETHDLLLPSHLFVLQRRKFIVFLKCPYEVGDVFKSAFLGNFQNLKIRS